MTWSSSTWSCRTWTAGSSWSSCCASGGGARASRRHDRLGARRPDYLTKPFSLAELLARVRVRLRDDAHPLSEVLRAGDLVLDVGRLEADIGHGPVALTRLEFLLLRELMEHVGQSVGKGQLLASVWGYDFDPGSNVVDVCVRRLRSKLGFELIKTVRGEGYRLAS
jgi:DNA-binding response OmpR family regulator